MLVATRCDKPHDPRMVAEVPPVATLLAAADDVGAFGLISTALALGIRHGFDWDHLAAITDVTSTTATADAAELDHEAVHEHTAEHALAHEHDHGGPDEIVAHETRPEGAAHPHEHDSAPEVRPARFVTEQRRALLLGSLY